MFEMMSWKWQLHDVHLHAGHGRVCVCRRPCEECAVDGTVRGDCSTPTATGCATRTRQKGANPVACNYDPYATNDVRMSACELRCPASCTSATRVEGACNYDSEANVNDGVVDELLVDGASEMTSRRWPATTTRRHTTWFMHFPSCRVQLRWDVCGHRHGRNDAIRTKS